MDQRLKGGVTILPSSCKRKKKKDLKMRIKPELDRSFFLRLRKTNISVSYFVFVKVTVMDLMMSSYKEIWMN